jgi:hypothetical protein
VPWKQTVRDSQRVTVFCSGQRHKASTYSENIRRIAARNHCKTAVADSRNRCREKSDPSKRHKFPMRATSYCGRGTGEKEINRYGQKERTQGKGSEGSANRNSFRVSDGHSKLPGITPATHLQPTESWHSVPVTHVTQTVSQGVQNKSG